jgi:AcrR family transcriptional regulator
MSSVQQRFSADDRRQQIMNVATELFSKQGYNGTTTRQIAAEARVNEAIIFRHFETKDDLYWAILDRKSEGRSFRETLVKLLKEPGSEQEKFTTIAENILRRREQDPSLTRLLLFSALENHKLSGKFLKTYVLEYFETLAEYIRGGIREGKFRPVDPVIAARGFLGMVAYHSLIQVLFGGSHYQKLDNHVVSRQIASLWLEGMSASRKRSDTSKKRVLSAVSK